MSDENVVVSTNGSSVSVPVASENDDVTEVDSQWLESLFAGVRLQMEQTVQALAQIRQDQESQRESLSRLEARLPENLTSMIESQQATITALVRDGQETLRSLLTPNPAPPVEIQAEEPIAEVENPVPETKPPSLPKRRRI